MTETRAGVQGLLIVGLAVTFAVAVGVSQFAVSDPDGLEYVLEEHGLDETERDHALADFALAEYGENLSDNDLLNTAIAGIVGVLVTLALGFGILRPLARRSAGD